jgi:GNAT superfamily N-acetyltransferase
MSAALSVPFPAVLAPAIRVREATHFDGARLLATMARCSQGTDVVVTLVNSPDFFSRARIYERANVFLAEADGEIAGSAAVTIRAVTIGGILRRAAYEFQVFTAPEHRRKGVAQRLREAIEAYLVAERVELTTAFIIAGNAPSELHFASEGFRPIRPLTARFLLTDGASLEATAGQIRTAVPDDYPAIARLLTWTWQTHDHAPSWDADRLAAHLNRVPGLDHRALLVHELGGELVACAASWLWDEVTRFQVGHVAPARQPHFPGFRPGSHLRASGLSLVGYRARADLLPLIHHIAGLVRASGRDLLGLFADADDLLWAAAEGLTGADIPLVLHAKALRPGVTIGGDRQLYADILDL